VNLINPLSAKLFRNLTYELHANKNGGEIEQVDSKIFKHRSQVGGQNEVRALLDGADVVFRGVDE
jgi:hypothetical protein